MDADASHDEQHKHGYEREKEGMSQPGLDGLVALSCEGQRDEQQDEQHGKAEP